MDNLRPNVETSEPDPDPKPTDRTRDRSRGPWLVAVLALVIALAAMVFARSAASQAQRAENLADEALSQTSTEPDTDSSAEPSTSPEPETPEDESSTEPPDGNSLDPTIAPPDVLDPQAEYSATYTAEVLNPRATTRSSADIDLDEPRVGADPSTIDITVHLDFGSTVPYISLEHEVAAAEASADALTPEDCADLIRTGPVPEGEGIPAQRGTVLCVATSLNKAAAEGINQKLVLLRVTELGDEGRVTIQVDAWEVPR